MIAPQSSNQTAGRRGANVGAATSWRPAITSCLIICVVKVAFATPTQTYDINLQAQNAADELNSLSEQTGTSIVFPYDLVKGRKGNPVVGRLTLQEALAALLKDTGLSGGLSDRGVLTISAAKSSVPVNEETVKRGEMTVTQSETPAQTNRSRVARIATFLASITAAFSAAAQDAGSDTGNMENVIITAQKKSERLQDVPIPVSVVDVESLAENNQVLLRDFYSAVPGLSLSPAGNGFQNLSIRGITQGGYASPTVGFLIDDLPFGAESGSTENSLPEIDPADLERIEVLRGPQGTLYGASGMGGLVKIVTKDPTSDRVSGDLRAGISDVQNGAQLGYNFRGGINVPLSDTLAVRASAFERQDPGYIDDPVIHAKGINEAHVYGGRLAALWKPTEDFSLNLKALYQHATTNGASEVDALPGLGDLQQHNVAGTGGETREIEGYSATLKARLGSVDLISVTGYAINKYESSYVYGDDFDSYAEQAFGVSGSPLYSDFENKKFTEEIRLSGSIWHNVDWLAGAYYTHENTPAAQTLVGVDPLTGRVYGSIAVFGESSGFKEYSGFGDLTFHVTDRFDIQVGGRETHDDAYSPELITTGPFAAVSPATDTTSDTFNYLATPKFKITPDLMVYARFASGFRPGSGNDNPPPTAFCAEQNFQCAVKPDKTYSYELGSKAEFFDHTVSTDLSAYYIDWQNIQLSLKTPAGFVYQGNGSGAKSDGVEFTVNATPFKGLNLSGWISYDDAVMTRDFAYGIAGDRLPYTSKWSGNFSVQEDFPLWGTATGFVGGQVSYVGDRLAIFVSTGPRQDLPAYTNTDLHAGVRYETWTINAYVNNATDRRGLLNGGNGYPNPVAFVYTTPRTAGLTISKEF